MKKIITISLTLFLLTGCGNTITCKTKKDDISEIYKIKYSENTITDIKTFKTYKFNSKEEFKNFEPMMIYYTKTNENIESTYKKKHMKYVLKQVYNIENLSDEELKQYGLSKNKEELINNLKNSGLSCK